MPSAPPRSVTPIRPRWPARPASRPAHRHTSQTAPSAAVIRAGDGVEAARHDAGRSAAVVAGVDRCVVGAAVVVVAAATAVARRRRRRRGAVVDGRRDRGRAVVVVTARGHRTTSASGTTEHDRHDIAVTVGVNVADVPATPTCESCGATDERALRRPPPVRDAGRVGHAGARGHPRRGRAVVLLVLHALPARARRRRLTAAAASAPADGQHAAQVVPVAADARLDDVRRQLVARRVRARSAPWPS